MSNATLISTGRKLYQIIPGGAVYEIIYVPPREHPEAGTRVRLCPRCDTYQSLGRYPPGHRYCRACRRDYQRERYSRRNAERGNE